jgi:hypothetical protein
MNDYRLEISMKLTAKSWNLLYHTHLITRWWPWQLKLSKFYVPITLWEDDLQTYNAYYRVIQVLKLNHHFYVHHRKCPVRWYMIGSFIWLSWFVGFTTDGRMGHLGHANICFLEKVGPGPGQWSAGMTRNTLGLLRIYKMWESGEKTHKCRH